MNRLKIIVFAYSQLGYDCLKYLIEQNYEIVSVFTHQDQLNQENIWFDSVFNIATKHHIPTFFDNPNKHIEFIQKLQPDIIFSFYYRYMISEQILQIPRLGAFNVHGSLLPKYRGRCPVNWAIIMGEKQTGVTLHYMTNQADAGDIVEQEYVFINETENAGQLMKKIIKASIVILGRFLFNLSKGITKRKPQKLMEGQYFGGRSEQDSLIKWNQSAWQVHNLIRALQPYPNYPPAFTFSDKGKILIIKSLSPQGELFDQGVEGQVIEANDKYFKVCCCNGELLTVTQAVIVKGQESGQRNLNDFPSALNFLKSGQILTQNPKCD